MTTGRGREAKIRPEFRGLYPTLQTTEWGPVEAVLQQVAGASQEDGTKAGLAPGSRLLRDEHFEFRGSVSRPRGSRLPYSRATDGPAEHQRLAGLQDQVEAEHDLLIEREREAERTIARAERLRERADALQQEFERLRERTAELEFQPEQLRDRRSSGAPPGRADEP
jgi:hypothetical protein